MKPDVAELESTMRKQQEADRMSYRLKKAKLKEQTARDLARLADLELEEQMACDLAHLADLKHDSSASDTGMALNPVSEVGQQLEQRIPKKKNASKKNSKIQHVKNQEGITMMK